MCFQIVYTIMYVYSGNKMSQLFAFGFKHSLNKEQETTENEKTNHSLIFARLHIKTAMHVFL